MFDYSSVTVAPTLEDFDIDLLNQMVLNDHANDQLRQIAIDPPLVYAVMDNNNGASSDTPNQGASKSALYFAKNEKAGVQWNIDNVINSPLSVTVNVQESGIYRFNVIAIMSNSSGDSIPAFQICDLDSNIVQEIGGFITTGTQSASIGHYYTPSVLVVDRWLYGGRTYQFTVTTGILSNNSDIAFINAYQFPPTVAYFWIQSHAGTGEQIEVPNFQTPFFDIEIPDFSFSFPDFPDFTFPDFNIDFPDGDINFDPTFDVEFPGDFLVSGNLDLIEAGVVAGIDTVAAWTAGTYEFGCNSRIFEHGQKSLFAQLGFDTIGCGATSISSGTGYVNTSSPDPTDHGPTGFWGYGWGKASELIPITGGKVFAEGTLNFVPIGADTDYLPCFKFIMRLITAGYDNEEYIGAGPSWEYRELTRFVDASSTPGFGVHQISMDYGNPSIGGLWDLETNLNSGVIIRIEWDNTNYTLEYFANGVSVHVMTNAETFEPSPGVARAAVWGVACTGNVLQDSNGSTPDEIYGVEPSGYSWSNLSYGIV